MRRLRRAYGAGPLHLLGHLAAFAIAAYAVVQILGGGSWVNYVAWFVGAALLHDLVLLPLYSVADRLSRGLTGAGGPGRLPDGPPIVNHVRAPAVISGVLLLVYFPLILGLSDVNYRRDTGQAPEGYLRNWLLITAGLFLASAVVYLVRRRRAAPPSAVASPTPAAPAGER